MKLLPVLNRAFPQPKKKAGGAKITTAQEDPRERMLKDKIAKRNRSAIAPRQELLNSKDTLVTCLPYSSIEFVFNAKRLYANRQNPHPACIMYDWDEELPSEEKGRKPWQCWSPFPPMGRSIRWSQ